MPEHRKKDCHGNVTMFHPPEAPDWDDQDQSLDALSCYKGSLPGLLNHGTAQWAQPQQELPLHKEVSPWS
ncbi:hypothetical protein ACFX2I_003267 [Malus domestica]